MDRRCIWCDSTEHDRKDCDEHEALRRDLIYNEGNGDPFDGFSKATTADLPKRRYEEGPRGVDSGKKQLCNDRGNMCG